MPAVRFNEDTAAVAPDRGVFATRVAGCGCRGLPTGQHMPGCSTGMGSATHALKCRSCGYRTATLPGRHCGLCGAVKR